MNATESWKTHRLGELAEYLNGYAFEPSDWVKSGKPIIRIQNLTDSTKPFNYFDGELPNRYCIDTGDLLVSWSATLGSFIWSRGPALLNQHIFKVIPDDDVVDKEFLHFLLLNRLEEMARHAHGLAMKHITKKKFEALEVCIPKLSEQHRIVARIKKCMERVDEIEQLRSAAVTEAEAALPSVLNETFADLAGSHGTQTLGDVALETRYGTSRKCREEPAGVAILRIPNVIGGFVNHDDLKYCELDDAELSRLTLKVGDLLFVRTNGSRNLVGRCAIYNHNGTRCAYASYLIRVRLDQKRVLPHYAAFFLNSSRGRAEIDQRRRTSAGQYNINSENLRSIEFPVPPLGVQREVVETLQDRQAVILQLQKELGAVQAEASYLREAILRKAFAGEL